LSSPPDRADAARNLAGLLVQRSNLDAAEAVCRAALARAPKDAGLHNQIGSVLLERGDASTSHEHFAKAVELEPGNLSARRNLAIARMQLGNPQGALDVLGAILDKHPNAVEILCLAGGALNQLGRYQETIPLMQRALEADPDSVDATVALGTAYRYSREAEKALDCFRRAAELDPNAARRWSQQASMLSRMSLLEDAREPLARALSLDPSDPLAGLVSAQIARREGDAARARDILVPISDAEPNLQLRGSLHYELAYSCEALGQYAEAFENLSKANDERAQTPASRQVDSGHFFKVLTAVEAYFSQATLPPMLPGWSRAAPDDGLPTPYFLVGFPRSGTTLVERLLDAHPEILATDELPMVTAMQQELVAMTGREDAYPESLDTLDEAGLRRLREVYWACFEAMSPEPLGARTLVDKHPLNLQRLGLIYRTFPDARILVALRDPRDVCISCFASDFRPNFATVQFYDLATTVQTYARVMRLWQRYREILPLTTHTYRYEDLVADPPAVLGGIVEFLGLAWHDGIVEGGQKSAGSYISTPSFSTVTEPINPRSISRWERYAPQLEPLMDTLAPFIDDFGYG
jgi:tetratricopeptide (TPR) repeat protein